MKKLLVVSFVLFSSLALAQDTQQKKTLDVVDDLTKIACSDGQTIKAFVATRGVPVIRGQDGLGRTLFVVVVPQLEKIMVVRFENEGQPNEKGCIVNIFNDVKVHEKNLREFVTKMLGTPV